MRVKASRIENGVEICNTCIRPVESPFRYKTWDGKTRGCVSECHDVHIRQNTKPNWMKPRYVLPKWVTECRSALKLRAQQILKERAA